MCNELMARYILPVQVADAFGSIECGAFKAEAARAEASRLGNGTAKVSTACIVVGASH